MIGETHGHIALNGFDYKLAASTHKLQPDKCEIIKNLRQYETRNIHFYRDGGDKWGASELAAKLACDYGIDYRTPIFAIHKKGFYGSIVGKNFESLAQYDALVDEADSKGCDFIKIMLSGIMDFNIFNKISDYKISQKEASHMVNTAHQKGFSVMAHVNGASNIKKAIIAGVDSIEHGYYMDDECLYMLSECNTVWVPTIVPVKGMETYKGFDKNVVNSIVKLQTQNILKAVKMGVNIAAGSDAGSASVMHGGGIENEYEYLTSIYDKNIMTKKLNDGLEIIIHKFCR